MENEKAKVIEVNPKRCYFIATYPDGRIVKGNALSHKAWMEAPSGLSNLRYELSNGQEVNIPEYPAYSVDIDKEKGVYYAINVCGLTDEEIRVYRINLREVQGSVLKIGEVIIGRLPKPKRLDNSWKSRG